MVIDILISFHICYIVAYKAAKAILLDNVKFIHRNIFYSVG